MQYPVDFTEANRTQGICGVLAIAVAASRTLADAHAACKRNLMPHQKRHARSTYPTQIEQSLKDFGMIVRDIPVERQTVLRWTRENGLSSNRMYLIFTAGHVLTYNNGVLADQAAMLPVSEHHSRRCFVKQVMEVY